MPRPSRTARWIAALASLSTALALALAWVLAEPRGPGRGGRADVDELLLQRALADPTARAALVDELVRTTSGVYDAHPDPDVGRVLLPGLRDAVLRGAPVRTSALGLAERAFESPKPAGLTRVVLLGDSFVFGMGVPAEDRLGVFLEAQLAARGRGPVEVVHVGVPGWNLVAESEFLRRQLSRYEPDLVVQIAISNDLDDVHGARGFGALADFSPQHRERADSLVLITHPSTVHPDGARTNPLLEGLDWESRERYRLAGESVLRLVRAVEASGARYLLVSTLGLHNAKLYRYALVGLEPDRLAFVDKSFMADESRWVGPLDGHWNRGAHEEVATLLYGLIEERGLLPGLAPAPWDEARDAVLAWNEPARLEALALAGVQEPVWHHELSGRLDFRGDPLGAHAQVYGGVDAEGRVSPYASLVLAGSASRVRLRGRCLDRPELDGARLSVFADEARVGEVVLARGREVDATWELPEPHRARPYRSVRLVADDWVHAGERLRDCVAFELHAVELE